MWQSVEGYVIIQIEGAGVERLLNRLQAAGIPVRDVARSGRGVCRCRLRPRDFRRLHALCGGCRCRVRIQRRVGLPIRMARLMRRRALLCGLLLVAAAIAFFSTRICIIRVVGCERVAERTVLRSLASLGVSAGRPRSGLSLPALAERLMASDERIAWAYGQFLVDVPVAKLRAIERLRSRGIRTYVLSNNNPASMKFVEEMFRADRHDMEYYFDAAFLSYQMHELKPSEAIFRQMIDASGMIPEETLFIDDGLKNIETARRLGFAVYMPAPGEDFGHVLESLAPEKRR